MFLNFHKMPVIYATYLSAFPTFVPADVPPSKQCLSKTVVDQYLMFRWPAGFSCVSLGSSKNKMTVITSETTVFYLI